MMPLFDTHCHFETSDPIEIAAILERAYAAGVTRLLAVGGSKALNASVQAASILASTKPSPPTPLARIPLVSAAMGFDRDQIGAGTTTADALPPDNCPLSAWGEIGLDYYYSPETRDQQRTLFAQQLEIARSRNLPVIIHSRDAEDDTVALLREIPSRGVIHCYTGTPENARRFLDLGFYVSISGIVTFRAADNVRATAKVIPDDRLLIETDAPYLAPVPMRGKTNEPAFLAHTCAFLAELRGTPVDAFAQMTFQNGERCFCL